MGQASHHPDAPTLGLMARAAFTALPLAALLAVLSLLLHTALPLAGSLDWVPALGIRLASSLPFAVAVGWGAVRLVSAVYGEIIAPGDVTVPIVIRVVAQIATIVSSKKNAASTVKSSWCLATTNIMAQHITKRLSTFVHNFQITFICLKTK